MTLQNETAAHQAPQTGRRLDGQAADWRACCSTGGATSVGTPPGAQPRERGQPSPARHAPDTAEGDGALSHQYRGPSAGRRGARRAGIKVLDYPWYDAGRDVAGVRAMAIGGGGSPRDLPRPALDVPLLPEELRRLRVTLLDAEIARYREVARTWRWPSRRPRKHRAAGQHRVRDRRPDAGQAHADTAACPG